MKLSLALALSLALVAPLLACDLAAESSAEGEGTVLRADAGSRDDDDDDDGDHDGAPVAPATDEPDTATADAGPPVNGEADAGAIAPAGPLLKEGLHPAASDALRSVGITAAGISQTLGTAAASAGTHEKDGTANGKPYSAATDLRTNGMTEAQIRTLLGKLGDAGFVAWYRKTGADGWSGVNHIHAVWAAAPMKLSLRNQVRDWLVGKNGLQSHTTYQFYTWPQATKDAVRARFVAHNPATG